MGMIVGGKPGLSEQCSYMGLQLVQPSLFYTEEDDTNIG